MALWTVYLSLCLLMALSASACSSGWSAYGDRCFRFFHEARMWKDAEKICLHNDGNLASVHSKEEYTFIQNLIKSETNTGTRTWLGGHDAVQEGEWLWSDGSQMNFQWWSYREPNNDRGQEHCLEMNHGNGNWNDITCYKMKPFVCVK